MTPSTSPNVSDRTVCRVNRDSPSTHNFVANTVLASGSSEVNLNDGKNSIRQCALESEYDYETDSDLDEFEDFSSLAPAVPSTSGSCDKGRVKDDRPGARDDTKSATTKMDGDDSALIKHHRILLPTTAFKT